jgi:predicted Zn-dependent protease
MAKIDTFDVANWRPITPQSYVEELAEASATLDEPEQLVTKCVQLPDTRMRLVTYAHVLLNVDPPDGEPQSDVMPYLMVMADLESGKSHCFMTTVGSLAHQNARET